MGQRDLLGDSMEEGIIMCWDYVENVFLSSLVTNSKMRVGFKP